MDEGLRAFCLNFLPIHKNDLTAINALSLEWVDRSSLHIGIVKANIIYRVMHLITEFSLF